MFIVNHDDLVEESAQDVEFDVSHDEQLEGVRFDHDASELDIADEDAGFSPLEVIDIDDVKLDNELLDLSNEQSEEVALDHDLPELDVADELSDNSPLEKLDIDDVKLDNELLDLSNEQSEDVALDHNLPELDVADELSNNSPLEKLDIDDVTLDNELLNVADELSDLEKLDIDDVTLDDEILDLPNEQSEVTLDHDLPELDVADEPVTVSPIEDINMGDVKLDDGSFDLLDEQAEETAFIHEKHELDLTESQTVQSDMDEKEITTNLSEGDIGKFEVTSSEDPYHHKGIGDGLDGQRSVSDNSVTKLNEASTASSNDSTGEGELGFSANHHVEVSLQDHLVNKDHLNMSSATTPTTNQIKSFADELESLREEWMLNLND